MPASNIISGLDGNDQIDGKGGGHDVLHGGKADDTITSRDAPDAFGDVGCGTGTGDKAIVDAADVVATDCENIDRSAPNPGGGTGGGGPGGGGSGPGGTTTGLDGDRTSPNVVLTSLVRGIKRATIRSRGLSFFLTLNEPARLEIELLATASGGRLKDNLVLARRTIPKASKGRVRIILRPDRGLLRLGAIKLRIRATDGEGNLRTVTRTITVRR